ncbi:MAG: hypothetical protein RIT27_1501 [Pseudomonadota bacterium]|jgi:hypothetical protein
MLSETVLNQIVEKTLEVGAHESGLLVLKQMFPTIHFTLCSDDDILNAKPVRETAQFNLYLVNTSQHCAVLTNDTENASGVVIAWRVEEED